MILIPLFVNAVLVLVFQEKIKLENTWEVIDIDFTGPSEKLNGNILLTIIDHASRFPLTIKLKSTDAANTIQSLSNLFSIFGLPKKTYLITV